MENYKKGILYAIITSSLWGFLAIALKVASSKVDSSTIVWFRFFVAFTILFIYQLIKAPSETRILTRPPWLLIIAALGLSWNYMGFMQGIHYTSPANTQVIIQTGPIMLALVGILFFKEKVSKQQIIGFALVVAGMITFYQQQIKLMLGAEQEYNTGFLFTISAALAWVVYASLQKQLVRSYSTNSLNLVLFGIPVIIFFPFTNLSILLDLHWGWWILMIFLGLNTLVAYGSLAMALKYIEANKVSIIIILNPVITFVSMAILTYLEVSWIAGEHFSFSSVLGALIVLGGAILVIKKNSKKKE